MQLSAGAGDSLLRELLWGRQFSHVVSTWQSRLRSMPLVSLAICLMAAFAAQSLLDKDDALGLALVLYAVSALLFAVVSQGVPLEAQHVAAHHKYYVAWELLAGAVVLGVLAFFRFGGNRFTPDGALLWGLGFLLLRAALWSPQSGPIPTEQVSSQVMAAGSSPRWGWLLRPGIRLRAHQLLLFGIMLLGAVFRLRRIDIIHQEMGCDLPHIYRNIQQIIEGQYPIFFPSHPGREGLFFYLAAPLCKAFGLTHTHIKIAAALTGTLTIPAIYLLGKELFNRRVGYYAAFFLSISHWHTILTRIGYRLGTLPLVLILMWLFLVRAFKAGRRSDFAWAGFFLGLGLYSYNSFMIVPALVAACLLAATLTRRRFSLSANLGNILVLAIVAIYVFIPLGRYISEDFERYFYRAATRITSKEQPLPPNVLQVLLTNTVKTLVMFNYRGDALYVNNVPFHRELGFLTAMLFILGLSYLLARWREGNNVTVLLTLGIMLLPTILSVAFPNEVPNVGRAIGALPAAMLCAAVAASLITERVSRFLEQQPVRHLSLALTWEGGQERVWLIAWQRLVRWGLGLVWVAVLALEANALYSLFFTEYVKHIPVHDYPISLKLAQAIDDFWDDGETYIKIVPYWYDENALRVQLRRADPNWPYEQPELRPDAPPLSGPPGKFMIILHPDDREGLALLQRTFPRGIALTHSDYDGRPAFITFYGER